MNIAFHYIGIVTLLAKITNTDTYSKFKHSITRLIWDVQIKARENTVYIYKSEVTTITTTICVRNVPALLQPFAQGNASVAVT
jgi:hypothetical protein